MSDFMRRITTLGRPLETDWPTNRAVLLLLPVGGAVAFGRAYLDGGFGSPVVIGILGAMTVLLSWALGREVAPDPQGAAFVSMALGFTVFLIDPTVSLLLTAVALVLARTVNRTVGLPASAFDTVSVLGLVIWAVSAGLGPGPALAATLAFALDALLPPAGGPATTRRPEVARQWAAAAVSLLVAAWGSLGSAAPLVPAPDPRWALPGVAALLPVAVLVVAGGRLVAAAREVKSRGDATDVPLSPARVQAAVIVVLAVAVGGVLQGDAGARSSSLVWASLAGAALWRRRAGPA